MLTETLTRRADLSFDTVLLNDRTLFLTDSVSFSRKNWWMCDDAANSCIRRSMYVADTSRSLSRIYDRPKRESGRCHS